jgi:hypothetical protein
MCIKVGKWNKSVKKKLSFGIPEGEQIPVRLR